EVDVIMKPPEEMVGRNENVIQSRVLAQNEFLLLCNHTSNVTKSKRITQIIHPFFSIKPPQNQPLAPTPHHQTPAPHLLLKVGSAHM
ncbi:MAG: hypothetical protein SPJ37_01555, partial [Sodaliphilus sp.]|nr:hypothetical protein [Sodaliphilus sp.]